MKNLDFSSLTNIKAPDSWIENALNIPSTVEKKKPLLILRHSRAIAAVACLILVSVVSITIYLTSDRIVPPIDPNFSETDASVSANATDISSGQDETSNKEQSKQPENVVMLPTQPYELIEPTEGGSQGSQEPTQKPIVGPTLPNDPPENTEPSKPSEPMIKPTEAPTTPPTENPTAKPQHPTESPTESEVPDPPFVEPTEYLPPFEEPTESSFNNISFTCRIQSSLLDGDTLIYCKVYDSNGYLIGDSNEYSSQHRAYVICYSDGNAILSYSLPNGLITEHGTYFYYFYNRYGDILYQRSKYI